MVDWRLKKITLASKCEFFWTTNSDLYGDVTFLVGPKEEKMKSFKILLMVTSPVFEAMLGGAWSAGRGQDEPIPHIDPVIFRQFLLLLLTDAVAIESIEDLKLSMSQVLDLFFLSKEYLVHNLRNTLEEYIRKNLQVDTVLNIYEQIRDKDEEKLEVDTFNLIIKNAAKVLPQDDFLKISKPVLLSILSDDNLRDVDELFLFQTAHRWVEFQATWDENLRDEDKKKKVGQILRECVSEIRLPLISFRDWLFHVEPTGVLAKDKTLAVLKYLPLTANEKKSRHCPILELSDSLSVRTEMRHPFRTLVLSHQVDVPVYKCVGEKHFIWLKASQMVSIRGLGFCGPLSNDSEYAVTVFFLKYDNQVESTKERKLIFAEKESTFYFPLTTPFLMEKDHWYKVYFKLKGLPTGCTAGGRHNNGRYNNDEIMEENGIKFRFQHYHRQVVEIQYLPEGPQKDQI